MCVAPPSKSFAPRWLIFVLLKFSQPLRVSPSACKAGLAGQCERCARILPQALICCESVYQELNECINTGVCTTCFFFCGNVPTVNDPMPQLGNVEVPTADRPLAAKIPIPTETRRILSLNAGD